MAGVAMNGSFVLRGQTAVFAHVFLPGTSFLEKDGTVTNAERRIGETAMAVEIGERVPQGVVYAAFHHPASGANAIATEFFDWAANGPEYPTARNTQLARIHGDGGADPPDRPPVCLAAGARSPARLPLQRRRAGGRVIRMPDVSPKVAGQLPAADEMHAAG